MEGFDTGSLGNARVGGYALVPPVPWSEAKLMTLYHGRYISWLI